MRALQSSALEQFRLPNALLASNLLAMSYFYFFDLSLWFKKYCSQAARLTIQMKRKVDEFLTKKDKKSN